MRRRTMIKLTAAAGVAGVGSDAHAERGAVLTRRIPESGEQIPAIGMGTSRTFDVGSGEAARAPLLHVLNAFFARGGRLIDSSPMYGRAEEVTGELLEMTGHGHQAFRATKVWIEGRRAGIDQMNGSFKLMRTRTMDLMQVHNLVDTSTQLATMRAWKGAGKIRYLGVTHMRTSAYDEIERLMKHEKLDFVQLPYSIGDREIEKRLLPCAEATGTAVLVMRPFERGALFRKVRGKDVPEFARKELGVDSWAQLFLKWLLGHPAVTCPIPATSKPKHMTDNMGAIRGPLPDAKMREKIATAVLG